MMKDRLRMAAPVGMTLIEVVIVIAIIATLAAVAVPSIITTLDVKDREATMARMDNLEEALQNYYEDIGEYPSKKDLSPDAQQLVSDKDLGSELDYLMHNPYPREGTSMQDTIRHERWNGPYLTPMFNKDDFKKDAWARLIYYAPQYGRSKDESRDGQQYAGAEDLPANAALLASMGKTPGWGFRDGDRASQGGPTVGMVSWDELIKFIPYRELYSKKYEHLLKENVIRAVNPAAIDRVKSIETIERYEQIRTAVSGSPDQDIESGGCVESFAADVGLVMPDNPETTKPFVALSVEDFRDFDNPLQVLLFRFINPDAKDLYYGSPRDVPPPYRMSGPEAFNSRSGDHGWACMGWRGPYISELGESYTNEAYIDVVTYDCLIDGWCNPLEVYEGNPPSRGAVFDLNFGNRDEDEDTYSASAGLMASCGPNRQIDRMVGSLLDPNNIRPGGDPGGMFSSEGTDDDDVFVQLYKRDLWANIAPDNVLEGEAVPVNTPVLIPLEYGSGKNNGTADYVSGIAVIYADPSQAAGFNVVELRDSADPIAIGAYGSDLNKNQFTAVETNLYIPVGYAFFYVMVSHNGLTPGQASFLSKQERGYCKALTQRLGWKESTGTGVNDTHFIKVYGAPVCVKSGMTTIVVEKMPALLAGG
jgi:prepilin-type N-terminal cleavage/methylation domain-containing protein